MVTADDDVVYVDYTDESMLQDIQTLVAKDLSEPYSVFTYRYFLHKWPSLCVCVYTKVGEKEERGEMIAAIVCKADYERDCMRGYMAMLAVSKTHRNRGIGLKVSSSLHSLYFCMFPQTRTEHNYFKRHRILTTF
jgi:N-alpha-acetyltransferase 30